MSVRFRDQASLGRALILVTLVTVAASCDATRRDWSRCDPDGGCGAATICDKSTGQCKAIPEAGVAVDSSVLLADAPEVIDVPAADGGNGTGKDGANLTGLDVAAVAVDVSAPDAPGTCSTDPECPSAQPLCLNNLCAKCVADSDCAGRAGSPACDGTSGRCVACVASKHCAGTTPVCDTTNARCVGCLAATDCTADAAKAFCVANQCADCQAAGATACAGTKPVCATTGTAVGQCVECVDNSACTKEAAKGFCVKNACAGCQDAGAAACSGATPLCALVGASAGKCVACVASADCTADATKPVCLANQCVACSATGAPTCAAKNALLPVCDATGGRCVECTTSANCTAVATKPICDANQCRGCKKDSECVGVSSAGVCGLDFSCPGDANVIYVQNSSLCSTSIRGSGSATSPFCFPDDAALALSASKSVIVVHGTVGPTAALVFNLTGQPVLVAGQASATIKPPAGGMPPVVSITAGEVTLRDVTISGGGDTGISVTGGAILHMDRCFVLNNQGIGVLTNASAFDIVNTVIAGNGAGTGVNGVSLGAYTGTGPTKLAFNTVVGNVGLGVYCGANYVVTGILANGNGTGDLSANCRFDATTSTAAPAFSSVAYHLSAASPCVDAAGAVCPPDDIDGDLRPQGAACDCGADEYKP